MKKPKKKAYTTGEHDLIRLPKEGYNQACNDWERYLGDNYTTKNRLSAKKIREAIVDVLPNTYLIATEPKYITPYIDKIVQAIIETGNEKETQRRAPSSRHYDAVDEINTGSIGYKLLAAESMLNNGKQFNEDY